MSETIKTILTAETGKFHSEFKKATGAIDSYHKKILSIGAALGGSALLAGAVRNFNNLRNSINLLEDQAARLQMPVEEFQRLGFFAEKSGTSVETLSKALVKANLNAFEATQGSKGLVKDFAALGIEADKFLGLDSTGKILALSKGFSEATDKGAAYSAVFGIMGKSASELIPLLKMGETELGAISARLNILGTEDVAAVGALSDEIELLAANIKTRMGGAVASLSPQIKSLVGLLADSADGMAVFFDPAGGRGRQGGDLAGVEMLREMDKLTTRMDEIRAKQKSGDTWSLGRLHGPAELKQELKDSAAAVETLKARFAGLSEESKVYAEQLREFERLRASGLAEGDLRAQLQILQGRSSETLKALEAEKQLAVAASATAAEMEKQKDQAEKLVKAMETLQSKVGDRIISLQSPQKRESVAREELRGILNREGAGTVDELRLRVGSAPDDASKAKALAALDQALDKLQSIKTASAEIQSGAAANYAAWKDSIKAAHEASQQAIADGRQLVDLATDQKSEDAANNTARAAARADFQAEITALRIQLTGRKELAESFREETALRKEAADIASAQGLTEEQALAYARNRAALLKEITAQEEKAALRAQKHPQWKPRSEYRGIRRAENAMGDFNSGNNLKDWNPEWNMGSAYRGNGRSIKTAEGGLKQEALRRRGQERENAALRNSADPNTRQLQQLVEVTTALQDGLSRIGVIK